MRRLRPAPTALHTLLAAALLLPACDGHAPAAGKPPAAAKPAEKAEPAKAAGPDEDDPTPARTVAVELHRVAARRGQIRLHRLSDGEIALSGGVMLARVREGGLALGQDPAWLAGLPPAEPAQGWRVRAAGGRGDALWLTLVRGSGDALEFSVRRRRGDTWVAEEPGPDEQGLAYLDYTTWPEGDAIALWSAPGRPPRLEVLGADGARPARPRFEAAGLVGTPRPTALAGLQSGELFAAMAADEGPIAGLLRWGPGEATGVFAPLPALESQTPRQVAVLVEGDGHEVLVGDSVEIDGKQTPYVARFDGTLWRLLDAPPAEGAVASLVESPGPVIWAVVRAPAESGAADSLWRLQAGGDWDAWERVELAPVTLAEDAEPAWQWDEASGAWTATPGGLEAAAYTPSPAGLGRDAAGDLWLTAQLVGSDGVRTNRWVALRSRAAARPLMLLDDAQVFAAQQDLQPRRAPRAGDPTCPRVYVQLNTVPEDSSEPFAPELRAALAEGPLASALLGEVRSQGQRQVGLLVSLAAYEASKPALAGLAAKLKLKPKPSCGHPPLVRGWRAGQ